MKRKIQDILQQKPWLGYAFMLAIGLLLGFVFFSNSSKKEGHHHTEAGKDEVYTCSMHPQIKQDKPGKCPICGMDLTPLKSTSNSKSNIDPNAVMMSEEAIALANIQTEVVGTGKTNKEIRLFGKIKPSERSQQAQSAYVNGRVERLYINAIGDVVHKGQTVALIYSPELYTASQELIAALSYPDLQRKKLVVDAAIEKLKLLNVSQGEINSMIKSGKASPYTAIKANVSGTVISKNVEQGSYVKQGDVLLQIANLGSVWAVFEAYETDLPFIKVGQTVQFTAEGAPGTTFSGRISFVEPVLNAQTRTAGVRVEVSNAKGVFKPEMLISGVITANLNKYSEDIVVPKSAVLWTGKRSIVYVKDESDGYPIFTLREVTLGPTLPDGYIVTAGLADGEEIVTNGVFAIDASAQLDGKPSMMNR